MSLQTLNPLPMAAANFLAVLQAFLQNEDANRFNFQFRGFVKGGGLHGTAAGLTATPSPLGAFPGGFYITETGSITYADASTTWVIASLDTVGDLGGYTRVPGTHYLTAVVSTPLPDLCIRLMKVTTAGGAITAVVDQRVLSPLINQSANPFVRLIGTEAGGDAKDIAIVESHGNVLISYNIGTVDEPNHVARFAFLPANFQHNIVGSATALRNQTLPDKDGTFAMLSDITGSAFPPGTRMLFDNDVAPAGWVRDVVVDDRVVRIVKGARADGGSWTITGVTAAAHTLTVAEMPAHHHTIGGGGQFFAPVGGALGESVGAINAHVPQTDDTGGDGAHTHTVASDGSWRPLHRDVILCQKS